MSTEQALGTRTRVPGKTKTMAQQTPKSSPLFLTPLLDALCTPKQLFLQALSESYVHHQKIRKRIRSSRKKVQGLCKSWSRENTLEPRRAAASN
jgi:hypothetical protein